MEGNDTQTEDSSHFYSSDLSRSARGPLDTTQSQGIESTEDEPDTTGTADHKQPISDPVRINRDQILFSFF